MPTIKKLLTTRGDVLADDRTNALIISDIPSTIPQLDRLLTQLDRKTLEVEIEARVVAATRNFAQQFGTQVGFAWGNGAGTAVGGNPSTGTSPNTILGSVLPLLHDPWAADRRHGLSASDPAVLEPGGSRKYERVELCQPPWAITGWMFCSRRRNRAVLLKVLSRPRVVTQNNVTAVVRQGVPCPVVTQAQLARTGHDILCRCLSAADGDAADYGRQYDLSCRRCGKHDHRTSSNQPSWRQPDA